MNVIFICGCVEPGKDGVGDYVRRLSGTFLKTGHKVFIIALYDSFTAKVICYEDEAEGFSLTVMRFPFNYPVRKKIACAKQYVTRFDPDFLSLQYVPFSFNNKGLAFRLTSILKKIANDKEWQIMFHELWLGMEDGSSKKHLLWGRIQKQLILNLVNKLKPTNIFTQSLLYIHQLEKLGFCPKHLPLFGNIANIENNNIAFKKCCLNSGKKLRFVIFGAIHPHTPVINFTAELANYAASNQCSISLVIIGRASLEIEKWISCWHCHGLQVDYLGEQPSKEVSRVFQTSDIGISTTPLALIDKSGSVAAMLEHQLPIVCVSKQWAVKGFKFPCYPGIIEYQPGNFTTKLRSLETTKVSTVNPYMIVEKLLINFQK